MSRTLYGLALTLSLPVIVSGDSPSGAWREVLHQAFQTGALSAEIRLNERVIRVPIGWESLPAPREPEKRWTMARWDGGNDRRRVNRTYLVTNGSGLPDCWLTKILSYEVREFELECVFVNYGTPAELTIRVVDDQGLGYDGVFGMGVKTQKHRLRRITAPRTVSRVDGKEIVTPERAAILADSNTPLPMPERLRWYRPRLTYKEGTLSLSLDGRVLVRAKNVPPRSFTAVQFLSPQRVFLDDFSMWGRVQETSEP